MRGITNTSKQDPLLHLLSAMTEGADGMIEAQETRGQKEFVSSDVLPVKGTITDYNGTDNEKILTDMGFQLGETVKGDKLFRYAKLPPSWKKERTSHSMWSNIVDEKGRIRASVFYKAAFYDRDAFLRLTQRFSVGRPSMTDEEYAKTTHLTIAVLDGGKVFKEIGQYKRADWKMYDELQDQAKEWLKENYPDYQNVSAYWD